MLHPSHTFHILSQAVRSALLAGLCAERIALNPASFKSLIFSFFYPIISTTSQNSIVVMNTSATQFHTFVVNQKSSFCRPAKFSDSKKNGLLIDYLPISPAVPPLTYKDMDARHSTVLHAARSFLYGYRMLLPPYFIIHPKCYLQFTASHIVYFCSNRDIGTLIFIINPLCHCFDAIYTYMGRGSYI